MDFLFDNPLANLYGPYFLVFYGSLILVTIFGYYVLKKRLDRTALSAIPPIPINPDPFEIAYLRGGINELARATIFSLNQKNLLQFINDDKNAQITPTGNAYEQRDLKGVERTALEWFNSTRSVKELFAPKVGLTKTLEPFAETYRARLEMQNFIPDKEFVKSNNRLKIQAFLFFAFFGFYKLAAAIYHGFSNFAGIIIITFIGMILLGVFSKLPRLTKLGENYLKRLQLAFDKIKPSNHYPIENQATVPSASFAAVDPFLLSVGVFGGAALAGTVYSDYNLAFERAQNQSATGSGGCGAGCGSGSSSSSCSSGSGCSSGCGGCGGGCGG